MEYGLKAPWPDGQEKETALVSERGLAKSAWRESERLLFYCLSCACLGLTQAQRCSGTKPTLG